MRVPLSPDRGLPLSTNRFLHVLPQISNERPPLFIVVLIRANSAKSGRNNINRPPTTSTGNFQGQPRHPMPAHFDKYCYLHGRGIQKGVNYNSKGPGNKYKDTMENNIDGRNYGCIQCRFGRYQG